MLKKMIKGQSSLEYAFLVVVALAAFLSIGNYFKRGIQGRWKGGIDSLGHQYDPRTADSKVTHALDSIMNSKILAIQDTDGYWTKREDFVESTDRKFGYENVGEY